MRHARANRGHPRAYDERAKDLDVRDKPGHDHDLVCTDRQNHP
jgi:hypothetical protein